MDKTVFGRLKLMITGNSQEMVVEGMVHRLLSVGNSRETVTEKKTDYLLNKQWGNMSFCTRFVYKNSS